MGGVGSWQSAGAEGGVGGAVGLGSLLVGGQLGVEPVLVGGVTHGPLATVGKGEAVAAGDAALAVSALLVDGHGAVLAGGLVLERVWGWLAVVIGSVDGVEGLGSGVEVTLGVEPA